MASKAIAKLIRKYFGNVVFRKQLPKNLGGGVVYLVPKADIRGLFPGWSRVAPDLVAFTEQYLLERDPNIDTVVWDIGSNQGIFSAMAAGALGEHGTILSVEADPYYAALQERTIARLPKRYSKINVFCSAVADITGILKFQISSSGHARSHLESVGSEAHLSHKMVPSTTLDALLQEFGKPHFVKLDVEGAEHLCLIGATRLLEQARPIFYIEVSDANAKNVTEIFKSNRYALFKLHLDTEPSPISLAEMYTIALPLN